MGSKAVLSKKKGSGRGSGKAVSADSYRQQLTRVIAKLGDEEVLRLCAEAQEPGTAAKSAVSKARAAEHVLSTDLRYQSGFPFQLHDRGEAGTFQRYEPGQEANHDEETGAVIDLYLHAPARWWTIIADALRGGMRVSALVPRCWAVDVAAHAAQELVDCRVRASYDVPAGRLVLIHEEEEAIREKLVDEQQ